MEERTVMMEQTEKTQPTSKVRAMTQLKYPLPNPDISFDRHWEILKAYVLTSREGKVPVSYKDFGKLTVSPTHISANNKFSESIGLLSRVEGTHGKYVPTPQGIAIQRELTWKREQEAKNRLAELLVKSWFWESARNLISMREKVAENDLLEQLGYDSGADPMKHKASLGVLLQFLTYSDLISEEDGMLVMGQAALRPVSSEKSVLEKPANEQAKPEPSQRALGSGTSVLFGVLVSPEMSEDQIRKAVRIILEEIGRSGSDR